MDKVRFKQFLTEFLIVSTFQNYFEGKNKVS